MSSTKIASNATAPTRFLDVNGNTYAYRRFGRGSGLPLLFLQHFTGTLDNWDPAVTDSLASGREVIVFVSGARAATSRRRLPKWRDIHWPFSAGFESNGATSSGTPLAGWSPFKWCESGRRFFGE